MEIVFWRQYLIDYDGNTTWFYYVGDSLDDVYRQDFPGVRETSEEEYLSLMEKYTSKKDAAFLDWSPFNEFVINQSDTAGEMMTYWFTGCGWQFDSERECLEHKAEVGPSHSPEPYGSIQWPAGDPEGAYNQLCIELGWAF